jgi:cardiolipin synthase
MTIPNFITLARLLLVPLAVWLIISEAYGFAFIVFLVAGASDAVDGYLARRFGLLTELGALLDPIADKALLVSVYATLAFMKVIPAWLAILVVTRDVLIVGAIVLTRLIGKPLSVRPILISKLNTLAQIAYAVAVLGVAALDEPVTRVALWAALPVGVLTALSGGAYLITWVRHIAAIETEGRKP